MKNVFLIQSSKRILKRPEEYLSLKQNYSNFCLVKYHDGTYMCNFTIFDCREKLA